MPRTESGRAPPRHRHPPRPGATTLCALAVVAALLLLRAPAGHAQDIEPRAYSNAPVGVNFVIAGAAWTQGGFPTDSGLPITDPHLETSSTLLAYARALDLWGKSGKLDVIVPYTFLSGTAQFQGEPVSRDVDGFADPLFRLSVNLYGAPALSLPDFAGYRQDLIVGASLQLAPPWGQYDDARLVNIGSNRWMFRPELGVSKALGSWTLEMKAAASVYTDNDEFYGGTRREQEPLYSIQGNAIYSFRSGQWASVGAQRLFGGRTTIDGTLKNDLQQNWRVGAIYAFPLDRLNSIKIAASSGVSDRTGNSFDLIAVAWQHRWGGGL